MKFSQLIASFSLATTLILDTSFAANYTVTSLADTNSPGTLRYVINQINQAQSSQVANVTFAITGSCTLGSNLPPVLYPASFSSALPFYVNGNNQYRGLILYPGPQVTNSGVSLSGISFSNCVAAGGSGGYTLIGNAGCGGGGGAGLGGAIFVGPNVNATFTSGNMISCVGQGGSGGTCAAVIAHSAGGGGGGMAGFGGGVNNLSAVAPVGAGGGGGLIFNGGNGNGSNWAAGGGGAGGPGQDGSSNPTQAGFGGTSTPFGNAGNGGNSTSVIATGGNTFGGGGGDVGISIGGFGGFGAGGGGGGANSAGAPGGGGGFGGGGGGSGAGNAIVPTAGGAGGYGGGGGGGASGFFGAGGFGGAAGKASGNGGGGAGLGGALFIHQNAVCNLVFGATPVQFSSNSVTVTDAQALALGPDIFMMSGATLNLNNQQATPYTLPSAIVSDYPSNNSLTGGITVRATQPIILSGTNSFTGGIEVISGTLSLGPTATFLNLNPLVVESGGCFDTSLSTLPSIQVGEIISSGTQDGLINIGVTNLGVTLFNSDGSFNGGFSSGALGVLTFNSSLSGSTTAFTYSGASSNFLGTVTVNPGVSLFLGQGGNFSGTTTFNLAGGTLDVSLLTSNQTVGPVIGTGTLNLGTQPLTVNPFYSCTFAGSITGSSTLNVYGSNVNYWTLNGSSSFSGTVNLPASQVMKLNGAQIPALFNLSALSTLYVNGSSAINNLAGYGNVILSTGDSLSFNTTGTSSFYGAFGGPNNSSVVVNGSGSLALYGNNQGFSGNFIINGGSLILEDLGKLPQVITINKPGTLDISNVGPLVAGNNVDLSNITGSGNVNIGAQNLVFVNSTAPIAPFTGGIIGTGNITFSGINPFLLGGNLNTTGNIIIDPVGVTLSGSASISPCNSIIFMGGTLTAGSISGFNLYNVSGTGSIVGGSSTLNFLNSQNSSFSGTLTSNGGLTFSGSSTLSLNTQGTINGSCVISSGTVNLLQGGVFGSCSNLSLLTPAVLSTYQTYATLSNLNGSGVLYHGTMPVDIINGTLQTLAGTISGSGTVTFQLGATATLLGQFYSNSPIKSLAPIELEPSGLMTLDNTFDVLNNMSINGTGYVFMNATSSAQTLLNQDGALIVNGLLTCGNLNLLPNALLGGVGTVSLNGTFYPQGLIAPGFNPFGIFGTLTLNTTQGVEFTSSSGFDVSFGSNGQDSLSVQGNCQIDPGSTLVVKQESTLVVPFKQYTILQTTGGVSGVFSSIQSNIDPSQIQVIYNPSSVEIALQAKLIASGNAKKVASVLNQNMLNTDPEVINLISNLLIAQSQKSAQNALDQLQLSPFKSASLIGDNLLTNVMLGVIKELELDAITKYVCSCRLPKQLPKKYNALFDTNLFDDVKETNNEDCTKNYSGHIYLKGIGSSYFQKNHGQYAGYKTLDGGLLLGGRYEFAKYYSLNLAVAYQTGKINLYRNRGHIGLDQVSTMVLANYASKHLEAALGYAYGYTRQQDVRKVNFVEIGETARNNHASSSQAGFLKAGLLYNISKTTTISPYDYVSYIYQNEDAFTERNGGVVDLTAQKSTSNFIRNELGIRFNHCRNYDSIRLKAFLKGAYVQEIRFNSANYTQKFLALPQSFTTSGYMPTRALGLFGVGLNAGYGEDQFDFGFLYDVEGCHDYIGQRFEIGFTSTSRDF